MFLKSRLKCILDIRWRRLWNYIVVKYSRPLEISFLDARSTVRMNKQYRNIFKERLYSAQIVGMTFPIELSKFYVAPFHFPERRKIEKDVFWIRISWILGQIYQFIRKEKNVARKQHRSFRSTKHYKKFALQNFQYAIVQWKKFFGSFTTWKFVTGEGNLNQYNPRNLL